MKQSVTLITTAGESAATVADWRFPPPYILAVHDGAGVFRLFTYDGERPTVFGGSEYRYRHVRDVAVAEAKSRNGP